MKLKSRGAKMYRGIFFIKGDDVENIKIEFTVCGEAVEIL